MNKYFFFSFFLVVMGIQLAQGAGKLSWFYLAYGIDMEYWIDADRQIHRIDEIARYPANQEKPKTFQMLKVGGIYSFNELMGLYFELPFYYNRVESYQADVLPAGQQTEVRDTLAWGDTSLGFNLKSFDIMSTTLLVKLPSFPLEGSINDARQPAAPWAGLGVMQIGLHISAKLKNHFLFASGDFVVFDPFAGELNWVLPGDHSLFFQYVYEIKLIQYLRLKPWVYLNYSSYHWNSAAIDPDRRMNLGPGVSLSLWLGDNKEISLNTSWSLLGLKQRGETSYPNTRSISLGLYYGMYQ